MFRLVSLKAIFAEFMATMMLVFVGCFTAILYSAPNLLEKHNKNYINTNNDSTIAFVFGTTISTLVYSTAHISGQINPIVTTSLVLINEITLIQGLLNILSQCLGSVTGTLLLYTVIPNVSKTNFGANSLKPNTSILNAFVGELIMSFLLVYVVLECAIKHNKSIAGTLSPIAIGLAVFLGHIVLIPITGCSINPARSLGPALINNNWKDFWIFVSAPFSGSLIALFVHKIIKYNHVTPLNQISNVPVQPVTMNHGFMIGKNKSRNNQRLTPSAPILT